MYFVGYFISYTFYGINILTFGLKDSTQGDKHYSFTIPDQVYCSNIDIGSITPSNQIAKYPFFTVTKRKQTIIDFTDLVYFTNTGHDVIMRITQTPPNVDVYVASELVQINKGYPYGSLIVLGLVPGPDLEYSIIH